VGTINLDPEKCGTLLARLAPLPAFRRISRLRRIVARARDRDEADDEPSVYDVAEEDGAEAVLGNLRLLMADESSGQIIANVSIELLEGEPPFVRVTRDATGTVD
jgi:hypothetical protein